MAKRSSMATIDRSCWWILCVLVAVASAAADDSIDPRLAAYLDACDAKYSAEHQMLGRPFSSPGYHSTVAAGTWTHPTRQSFDYAAALLARNASGDADRAAQVIRKLLTLQDTDPASHTYGIWPWVMEEPLAKMSPPDWNWADFCGARIAEMLVDDRAKLPEDLVAEMRSSLGHAARAIRKRNVQPTYTNIAIMGGGVCAAAGELLADAEMLDYGRRRLQGVVEHTAHDGSFNEFNSPTYTLVALWECERTLHLVADPATREAAESLRRTAWEIIAESFHPGTQQWAGPHSRAYGDRLSSSTVRFLADQTGAEIRPHPSMLRDAGADSYDPLPHLPCPAELAPRFRALPSDPLEIRRTFQRGEKPADTILGTTWHTTDACLGSVNRSMLWTQRRALIGYWRTDDDPAVVFRLRFLHDDRDFTSIGAATAQQGGRALSAFYSLQNHGDWHPGLDRPKDGVFRAADFRVRYELSGKGAAAESLGEGRFALKAGNRRAVIHAPPGRFAGENVVWQLGQDRDRVFLDGICYHGEEKAFDFSKPLDVVLAAGVELLSADDPPSKAMPEVTPSEPGRVKASWRPAERLDLSVAP